VFPAVPLFTRGPQEVARLAELRADDAAARRSGRRTLVAALLAMGTGAAVPAAALGATGGATAARVQRLLDPPGRATRGALALMTVTLLMAAVSAIIPALAA
jgi:bla regulator protein blaR1